MPNRPPVDRSQNSIQGEEPARDIQKTHGGIPRAKETGVTQEWRTRASREGQIALVVVALCLVVAAVARRYTVGRPLEAETLVATVVGLAALLLAIVIGVLAYGHRSLRYRLDKRALTIGWLWMEETIPLAGIEAIFRGTRLGQKVRVRGVYEAGTAEADEVGPVKFYGIGRDPAAAIIVATAEQGYAITPSDLEGFRGRLIELLEAIPEGEAERAQETRTVRPYLPAVSPLELRRAIVWTAGVALGAALLWGVLQIPVDVPDTHTRTGASAIAEVNDWASTGNSFRTNRDGLSRIDVALSTLKRTDAVDLQFYVRDEIKGPNLRTLRVKLDNLPEGKALDLYKARWQDLPWFSFQFEPLYGYAGKILYFNIEGKGIPRANTVQVLLSHPNSYGRGEGYTSEKPADGSLIFHTYTQGNLSDLLGVTFSLLAEGKPGLPGQKWPYWGLATAGFGLAIAALIFVLQLQGFTETGLATASVDSSPHEAHQ